MSTCNQTLCTCGCCEEGGNQTPLKVENTSGLSALQYRVGTHSSFKETMLRELAKKQSLAGLTARYDDDMAIATLDAWATVLDVITFYQERIINEGYLRTTTDRLSVLQLARHISYKLAPGVAAGTYLAFTLNEAKGNPVTVTIPKGTKVQSVPGQDEMPQLFETIEDFEAKVEWNAMPVQTTAKRFPEKHDKSICLGGISTGLQPGDAILIVGDEVDENTQKENWDFRRIKEVIPYNDLGYTKVTWEKGLGKFIHNTQVEPARENVKVYAMKQKAFLFGYNAPDWRTLSKEVRNRYLPANESSDSNTDKEWKNFTIKDISKSETKIQLDNLYPKILANNWLVVSIDTYEEVYKIKSVAESAVKEFTLTSKTTLVELDGEHLVEKFNTSVRDAVIYAQTEEFEIADTPVEEPIIDYRQVTLQNQVAGLEEDKKIIISGKRKRLLVPDVKKKSDGQPKVTFRFTAEDDKDSRNLQAGESLIIAKKPERSGNKTLWTLIDQNGIEGELETSHHIEPVASDKDDAEVSELHTIDEVLPGQSPTVILLNELIENEFDPAATVVYANVAEATHGETKTEVLGSGDGSRKFQKFILKQTPLTYTSAATSSGVETTLEVRVNDILWSEVDSFYTALPNDKIYTVSIDNDGKVTVMFGDGKTGARLPTGVENIKATYRVGIGTEGAVNAGQLTLLLTQQPGLSKVNNPLAASGADDPETFDTAKTNAPLTVLTLDRIVSAKDYEDFTRAFAGIAKASVEILWSGEQQIVHITFAAADEKPVDVNSSLYTNLLAAIQTSSHANQVVYAENYEPMYFSISAGIKTDDTYIYEEVKAAVEASLTDYFSFSQRDFGQDVTPAEVSAVIQGVEGVIYADLNLLDGNDPFTAAGRRLVAEKARWVSGDILPAQLLTVGEGQINITQIT